MVILQIEIIQSFRDEYEQPGVQCADEAVQRAGEADGDRGARHLPGAGPHPHRHDHRGRAGVGPADPLHLPAGLGPPEHLQHPHPHRVLRHPVEGGGGEGEKYF